MSYFVLDALGLPPEFGSPFGGSLIWSQPKATLQLSVPSLRAPRYLRKVFTEDVVRELMGSATAVSELEKEWERLKRDREALRTIFPTGDSKVCSSLLRL